jgi:nucleoside-diphosphate-sugar epimerase
VSAPLAVVTGASGFVGSHVVDELLRHGARVRCLVRKTSPRRWLDGKPVELFEADLSSVPRLIEAVRGATWIVHAAGITRARTAAEYNAANVKGTETVLRAALEAGPDLARFLYVGSQAAAGPSTDGRPVTEDQRPEPVSAYGLSKLRAEQLVLLLRGRLPVAVIRPPTVYGPRDDAVYKYFVAAKRHLRPELNRGARFSVVYVEDLARAVRLALTDERAVGEVFFVAGPDETDYREMGDLVARALGAWTVPVSPPRWLLYAGALAGEFLGALSRRPPLLSREKLKEITAGDWICSSGKIRDRIGWESQVPLAEGVERTARWYREARWL